jgi:hypothetical protein
MRSWCVFDLDAEVSPGAGHESADSIALDRALDALSHPTPPNPDRLAKCRSGLDKVLEAKFQQVQSLITAGRPGDARKLAIGIDARFGGLAAPRTVDIAGP